MSSPSLTKRVLVYFSKVTSVALDPFGSGSEVATCALADLDVSRRKFQRPNGEAKMGFWWSLTCGHAAVCKRHLRRILTSQLGVSTILLQLTSGPAALWTRNLFCPALRSHRTQACGFVFAFHFRLKKSSDLALHQNAQVCHATRQNGSGSDLIVTAGLAGCRP